MNHHMTCKSISSRDKDAKSRKVLINLNTVQTGPIHMIIELDVYSPFQKKVHEQRENGGTTAYFAPNIPRQVKPKPNQPGPCNPKPSEPGPCNLKYSRFNTT